MFILSVVSCLRICLGKRIGDIFEIQSFSRVKTPGVHCAFFFFFAGAAGLCLNTRISMSMW